jgi:threonine aldolase
MILQVFYDPSRLGLDYPEIVERAARLPDPIKLGGSRLVVHIQTSPRAIDDLVELLKEMAEEKKREGFVSPEPSEIAPKGYKDVYVRAKPKP